MRKLKRKLVCVFLAALLLVSGTVAVARYAHIRTLKSGLSITSNTATCTGDATADCSTDKVSISVTLKRSTNGSSWSTWQGPWTASGTGMAGASLSKSASAPSGYYYKVTTSVTVRDGSTNNVIDSDVMDSPIKDNR